MSVEREFLSVLSIYARILLSVFVVYCLLLRLLSCCIFCFMFSRMLFVLVQFLVRAE